MPIRPEAKKLYPKNWKAIRASVLLRAGNKCEKCGRPNGIPVTVSKDGNWLICEIIPEHDGIWRDATGQVIPAPRDYYFSMDDPMPTGYHGATTVLTVAHLDHDPTNNAPENLRALCQRCHLSHDAKEHAHNARKTRARKAGHGALPGMEGPWAR